MCIYQRNLSGPDLIFATLALNPGYNKDTMSEFSIKCLSISKYVTSVTINLDTNVGCRKAIWIYSQAIDKSNPLLTSECS